MCNTTYQINKPKIVWFLWFKFLIIIKLNFNGDQFYKKIKFWLFKKIVIFAEILSLKLKMVNICVENFKLKILSECKLNR